MLCSWTKTTATACTEDRPKNTKNLLEMFGRFWQLLFFSSAAHNLYPQCLRICCKIMKRRHPDMNEPTLGPFATATNSPTHPHIHPTSPTPLHTQLRGATRILYQLGCKNKTMYLDLKKRCNLTSGFSRQPPARPRSVLGRPRTVLGRPRTIPGRAGG